MRNIGPHAVAYAVRCTPEDLRNWRRFGFLEGLGERKGKAMLYHRDEVLLIALGVRLARRGINMAEAFAIVRERPHLAAQTGNGDHYITVAFDPDVESGPRSISSARAHQVSFDPEDPVPTEIAEINVSEIGRRVDARLAFAAEHIAGE